MAFSSCLPLIEPITMDDTPTTLNVNKDIVMLPGGTVDGVDISTVAGAAHVQGTDTTLGIQAADLNMGANDITNVGLVDGVDVSAIAGSIHTQNTDWTLLDSMGGAALIDDGVVVDDLRTDRWMSNDSNTFLGVGAAGHGDLDDSGGGSEATGNTAIGSNALHKIDTGYFNTAVGNLSQSNTTTGIGNTSLGENTLASITASSFNTAIGTDALWQNTGNYNVALGMNAGANNLVGSSNVFLGYAAGEDEVGSNKLYIANSHDTTPLIYGDFSTDKVTINEDLEVADDLNVLGDIAVTGTVDGVDVSAHASRHQWQGADEVNIRDLQVIAPSMWYITDYNFGYTNTNTGTGYSYWGTWGFVTATGATNGSTAEKTNWYPLYHNNTITGFVYRTSFFTVLNSPTDLTDAWWGWFSDATTFPTITSNHYAIRALSTSNGVNCNIYATNGAGAAETVTQIRTNVPQYDNSYYAIVYGASNIKYYYSSDGKTWTLGATHTTNIPVNVSLYPGACSKNAEAQDKICSALGWQIMQGGQP